MLNLNILSKIKGRYRTDYKLAPLTRLKVGGKTDIFFMPYDLQDLTYFLFNINNDTPITIIGNGSNILIRDNGIEGVVIKLGEEFNYIKKDEDSLIVGGAVLNYHLVQFALSYSLSGMEFLIGIPGSIGGSIMMNAGCYGKEIQNFLKEITYINRNGEKIIKSKDQIDFSYRTTDIHEWGIIIEAKFYFPPGNSEDVRNKIIEIKTKRHSTQPYSQKTAGSTFMNPPNYYAWKLIESVGLRGYKIGNAEFSTLHCNFLINNGNSSSAALEELGLLAVEKIKEKHAIDLKWELKRLGK